jgi:putative addiction module component (TIGR02574 family)
MQLPSESVFEAALGLPEDERLALVSRLLETIPVDDSAISLDDDSLVEELDRRFADREGSVDWSALRTEH